MSLKLLDFKNIHKGKDIYVIASGKSLDFIDNSFFKNKILLGINQVYKKYKCKYLVRKETDLIDKVLNENPDTIHFKSRKSNGALPKSYNNLPNLIIYNHDPWKARVTKLPKEDNKLLISHSTITTGIHLAAYMGASNIILIGHDCGTLNGEPNFNGYHTNATYKIAHGGGKQGYVQWLKLIENDTIKLKEKKKKKYKCNIYSLNPFINFGLEGNIYKK